MSLKERYPNQGYVSVDVKITCSDRIYLCKIISDHQIKPKSITFGEKWPRWNIAVASVRVPIEEPIKPLEGKWSGPWENIEFLTEDKELIEHIKKIHHIEENGDDVFFIGTLSGHCLGRLE